MNALEPLGVSVAIGYAWQWARGPKKIPNWLGYIVVGLLTVAAWAYVTPAAYKVVTHDWRSAVAGIVGMYMTARGTASTASGIGIAPKTDSK